LSVQLVNARDVKNVPGRPKTDKLDGVWLAKLTEKGLLRPSFVPPAQIRRLRDYTRLRVDLTRERARYWQRLEKVLEDALIKVSSVASTLDTLSTRDMIEALIAGQRDPYRLAELARGKMKVKRLELIAALDGRFDEHHGELARMLLGQIDALSTRIDTLSARIEEQLAVLPDDAHGIEHTELEQVDPVPGGKHDVSVVAVAAPIQCAAPAGPAKWFTVVTAEFEKRIRVFGGWSARSNTGSSMADSAIRCLRASSIPTLRRCNSPSGQGWRWAPSDHIPLRAQKQQGKSG
jgi:Transposase